MRNPNTPQKTWQGILEKHTVWVGAWVRFKYFSTSSKSALSWGSGLIWHCNFLYCVSKGSSSSSSSPFEPPKNLDAISMSCNASNMPICHSKVLCLNNKFSYTKVCTKTFYPSHLEAGEKTTLDLSIVWSEMTLGCTVGIKVKKRLLASTSNPSLTALSSSLAMMFWISVNTWYPACT